jgi:diguanylate cyclase (GGDEF)-like protein
LTGLRNRRAFEEELIREVERSRRSASPLALVILDLDDLKQVNDELGHQAGDDQLRTLAASLDDPVRDGDAAYRIGGDEFAIVLPGKGVDGAGEVVARLQARLAARAGDHSASDRLGAAAGIAEAAGSASKDDLIRRADAAIYVAKRSHRAWAVYSDDHSTASQASAR